MKRYEVEVFIDGQPVYMMDVPSRSADAASRRAVVQTMSLHRQIEMERITARATGVEEDL